MIVNAARLYRMLTLFVCRPAQLCMQLASVLTRQTRDDLRRGVIGAGLSACRFIGDPTS